MVNLSFVRAFAHFYRYSPLAISWLSVLALFQTALNSLGILMLLPLAKLAGTDMSQFAQSNSHVTTTIIHFFESQAWAQSLGSILIVYALVAMSIAVLAYHRNMLGVSVQQSYIKDMRASLYRSILESRWAYLSSKKSSDFLHRVGAQVQSMNLSAQQSLLLWQQLVSAVIYIGLMFLLHWQFTLSTLLVASVVALLLWPIRAKVRDSGALQLRGYREIFSTLSEHLGNLKAIKISARESQFCDAVDSISKELEDQQVRFSRANSLISLSNAVGAAVGFSVLLYLGVTYFDVALAEFVVLFLIISRLLPQLSGIQLSVQSIRFTLPAFVDIEQTLEETALENDVNSRAEISALELLEKVELDGVSFTYSNSSKPTFSNLDLSIESNSIIALAGPSGIGKTTLADLLSGLTVPQSGSLTVDGVAISQDNRAAWRRSVAYVAQETYLFNDSIRANLSWSAPESSDTDLWSALELASLDQLVRGLPKQLDTHLGDRGIRLSGGERQRLEIARAILMQPRFLILDEATSALDSENEEKIHAVLNNLKTQMTILIIAHRQETLRLADRVIDVQTLR